MRGALRTYLWICALVGAVACWAEPALAVDMISLSVAGQAPPPALSVQWVAENGTVAPQAASNVKSHWVWAPSGPGRPMGGPVLRSEFDVTLPSTWALARSTGDKARLVSLDSAPDRRSIKLLRHMIVEQTAAVGIVDLDFVHLNGEAKRISAVLTADYRAPYIITHQDCPKFDMSLVPISEAGRHLFLGFSCLEDPASIRLYVVRSEDAVWDRATRKESGDQLFFATKLAKPQESVGYETRVVRISTRDSLGQPVEYAVSYKPKEEPRRWDLGAGLSGTYFSYKEVLTLSRRELAVTQWGLTGKAGFYYRLIPKLLTADLSMFGTLGVVGVSPSSVPGSKYLGVNGRIGYRLPIDLGATEWFFLAGWYSWMMFTSGNYGIDLLAGPQLFIQMNRARAGSRFFYAYAKLALVSDSTDFLQFANKEIAIGGGVALNQAPKPFTLGIDLASMQVSIGTQTLTLNTISLGVSKRY